MAEDQTKTVTVKLNPSYYMSTLTVDLNQLFYSVRLGFLFVSSQLHCIISLLAEA